MALLPQSLVFYIFVLTLITKTSVTAITSKTYANEDCSGNPATIAVLKVSCAKSSLRFHFVVTEFISPHSSVTTLHSSAI